MSTDAPGAANEPEGATNTGTGAGRRAEPGLPAPGTNQGTDESLSPTGDRVDEHPATQEGATAGTGTVGSRDAQSPGSSGGGAPPAGESTPAGEARGQAGASPMESRPRSGTSPGSGTAHRTPGHQGQSPDPIESDTAAGAAQMQVGGASHAAPVPDPGDTAGVPAGGSDPLEGTSAASGPVEGVRTPTSPTERGAGRPGRPAVAPRPSAPDGEVGPS